MKNFDKYKVGGQLVDETTGVIPDFINAWMSLGNTLVMLDEISPKAIKKLRDHTIPKYDDYLGTHKVKELVEENRRRSDPAKVKVIDFLGSLWNTQRKHLVDEQRWYEIELFWKMADKLIRG